MPNSSVRRAGLTAASLAIVAGIAAMTGACGAQPTATASQHTIGPTATTEADGDPVPRQGMPANPAPPATGPRIDGAAVQAAAAGVEPNTTLGAVVYDRISGVESLSVNADRQFRSASLVKLLIAIDALSRGADDRARQRIAAMLSLSDDKIASNLWVQAGSDLIPRMVALIGLQGTEAPELAGKWGEVKLTAHDVVRVYQYVMNNLTPVDHTLIVNALAQAPEFAADDFDQHFGIPDGLNTQWAIKQGWGNNSSSMVLHSTGLVGANWRYVVVLLTEHPLGSGWRTSAESVTAAAGALNGSLPDA